MRKIKRKRSKSSKPKKVTLKFFLNKAVQPIVDDRTKRYPLYVLITYDRKNTMLKCHYGKYYKDLDEIERVSYPGLLALEEKAIRGTITYELSRRGTEFDLKGIHEKYDGYCLGIHALLEQYLKDQLWSILLRQEPFAYAKALKFNDPDVSFETLYTICQRVYKGFANVMPAGFQTEVKIFKMYNKIYGSGFFQYDFPIVIGWLDGSMVDEFRSRLSKLANDSTLVNAATKLIERAIARPLSYSYFRERQYKIRVIQS